MVLHHNAGEYVVAEINETLTLKKVGVFFCCGNEISNIEHGITNVEFVIFFTSY